MNMTEQKSTATRKTSMDQLAKAMKATRASLAKSAGISPSAVKIDQLDIAVEKAEIEICKAIGVPPGSIEITVSPNRSAAT